MGFLRRLLGRDDPDGDGVGSSGSPPADDRGDDLGDGPGIDVTADRPRVSAWLRLADPTLLAPREQALVFGLEDRVMRAVHEAGVGEHEGNDLQGGYLVLRLCGPDADAIADCVRPHLAEAHPGSYLAVRRGPAGTAEDRLHLP